VPGSGESTIEPPKAIIFDIGRVIIRLDLARAFGTLGTGVGLSPEQVLKILEADPRWEDWQTGRMTPLEFHAHVSEKFRLSLGFEEFCDIWNRVLDPVTIVEECMFERLASSFRLALLSNTDPIHVAHIEARYSFVRHFPVRVYSCRVGAIKPSAGIYRRVLREAGVSPAEAVYIDDVPEYAAAACRLGMRTIEFTSPAALRAELCRLGVVSP
jgi:FMN phosphatase YigB (HAD superfamily)